MFVRTYVTMWRAPTGVIALVRGSSFPGISPPVQVSHFNKLTSFFVSLICSPAR